MRWTNNEVLASVRQLLGIRAHHDNEEDDQPGRVSFWRTTLLGKIRHRLGIRARNDEEEEQLEASGWVDVWIQATCHYWWIWLGPKRVRFDWYAAPEVRLYGMPEGTRMELVRHVFRPRRMNFRRSVRYFPRRHGAVRTRVIPGTGGLVLISNRAEERLAS